MAAFATHGMHSMHPGRRPGRQSLPRQRRHQHYQGCLRGCLHCGQGFLRAQETYCRLTRLAS